MGSNPTRCARKPFAFASGFFHAILQEKRHFPGQKVPKFGPLFLYFFSFLFLSFPYFFWSSPPVLPFLYFQLKISFHCLRRSEFGRIVEMGINIGCRAEIRVTDPFLDLLQRHTVSQQQAGAAVVEDFYDENVVFLRFCFEKELLKKNPLDRQGRILRMVYLNQDLTNIGKNLFPALLDKFLAFLIEKEKPAWKPC